MSKAPNVLFLFTDQQRFDTIHALGNERIITPALDEIAEAATVFDCCYTSSPVCVPARFSLFSGKYPARTGCNNNNASYVFDGEGFYAQFTKNGYQTCSVGKMHHPDTYASMGFEKRWTQEELHNPDDDYTKFMMNSPYSPRPPWHKFPKRQPWLCRYTAPQSAWPVPAWWAMPAP